MTVGKDKDGKPIVVEVGPFIKWAAGILATLITVGVIAIAKAHISMDNRLSRMETANALEVVQAAKTAMIAEQNKEQIARIDERLKAIQEGQK